MFKSIMVPVDLAEAELAQPAVANAVSFAKVSGGTVRLVYVRSLVPVTYMEFVPADFDARFELAQHAFARQQFTQAMDELLEILTRDKGWRDGLARKTYVAVLEVMGKASAPPASDPGKPRSVVLEIADGRVKESTTDTYRRRLSMVLF